MACFGRGFGFIPFLFLSYYDFCFIGDGDGDGDGRFAASRHENIIGMCIGLKYLKRTQNKPIITRPVKVDDPSCKLCLHVKKFKNWRKMPRQSL